MEQQQQLRITTWNALNPFYENEEYYTKEVIPHLHWGQGRRERVLKYLTPLESDVYCLQEVNPETAGDIHEALGKEKYTLVWHARTLDGDSEPDGCATLYRCSLLTLAETVIWRYPSHSHIFMACRFEYQGATLDGLWIVNTHVNYPQRDLDLNAMRYKLTYGKKFLLASKVIVGDFNAERTEPWYKLLRENRIIDATAGQPLSQCGYSYNSGYQAKWIDYVLLQNIPRDSVVRVFVDNDPSLTAPAPRFDDTSLPNARVPSDHLPLTVELRV